MDVQFDKAGILAGFVLQDEEARPQRGHPAVQVGVLRVQIAQGDRFTALPEGVELLICRGRLEEAWIGIQRDVRPARLEPFRADFAQMPGTLWNLRGKRAETGGFRLVGRGCDQVPGRFNIGQFGIQCGIDPLAGRIGGASLTAKGLDRRQGHALKGQGCGNPAAQAVAPLAEDRKLLVQRARLNADGDGLSSVAGGRVAVARQQQLTPMFGPTFVKRALCAQSLPDFLPERALVGGFGRLTGRGQRKGQDDAECQQVLPRRGAEYVLGGLDLVGLENIQ